MFNDTLKTILGTILVGGFLIWLAFFFVGRDSPQRKNSAPDIYFDQTLSVVGVQNTSPEKEVLILKISNNYKGGLTLSGLSLVNSAGISTEIGLGTNEFRFGEINEKEVINAKPGDAIYLVSGYSPVGASFRVNSCTGYLAQFQEFTPELSIYQCPKPEVTSTKTDAYCLEFLKTTSACTLPTDIPEALSVECREEISENFNYSSCVLQNGNRNDFNKKEWRVYLDKKSTLWDKNKDEIRLVSQDRETIARLEYSLGGKNSI